MGRLPQLHGIEPDEVDVSLPLIERVGYSLVFDTTRVGKTRLAELFVIQDLRRKNAADEHEVVRVIDPKGKADLLKRMAHKETRFLWKGMRSLQGKTQSKPTTRTTIRTEITRSTQALPVRPQCPRYSIRFVSTDPIRLEGRTNLYSYTPNP